MAKFKPETLKMKVAIEQYDYNTHNYEMLMFSLQIQDESIYLRLLTTLYNT